MKLAILMLLAVLAPRPPVYVKGHSRAAMKVRESLEAFTCYSAGDLDKSAAILHVDHLVASSGRRSWVVIFLTNHQNNVLWQGKAEEYPWPIPSPLNRLLRSMAKSTCPGYQDPKASAAQRSESLSRSQSKDAAIQRSPN
jgi:hypothetical protein